MDIIKLLLEKGRSVNLTNTRNNTPLHLSAVYGNLEATETLVRRGAALNAINIFGFTLINLIFTMTNWTYLIISWKEVQNLKCHIWTCYVSYRQMAPPLTAVKFYDE